MQGSWLYGDMAHGVYHDDHLTMHGCAQHCEDRDECHHWVFYVESGRCDLKVNHGGHNPDARHMVVGHSKRHLEFLKNKERAAEL